MRVLHLAIALLSVLASSAFAAAPSALYGKSITVSWNETRSQRDGREGPFRQLSLPFSNVFYVSSEGRLFTRTTARSPGGTGSTERVGTGTGGEAGARNVSFTGNRIVTNVAMQGAGRRIEVNFDSSFASCSAQVITGLPAGKKTAVVTSMVTGGIVEIESVSAGAASCSITSGNPF